MPSSHLILCHPLLLLLSIFPSIRVFSSESALCFMWPKNWSFSFSISPSSEYSGLISFGIHWLDLLAVQGTLKSLFQHHSSSILWCSAFFMVQLSHLYMTTGKTVALIIWIFLSKVIALLFNILSTFVIAFLARSRCLNFMATVAIHSDFGSKKIKSVTVFTFPHHFMANRWGKMETVTNFIFLGSKLLRMVTAAMKLIDACSLEEKL